MNHDDFAKTQVTTTSLLKITP